MLRRILANEGLVRKASPNEAPAYVIGDHLREVREKFTKSIIAKLPDGDAKTDPNSHFYIAIEPDSGESNWLFYSLAWASQDTSVAFSYDDPLSKLFMARLKVAIGPDSNPRNAMSSETVGASLIDKSPEEVVEIFIRLARKLGV